MSSEGRSSAITASCTVKHHVFITTEGTFSYAVNKAMDGSGPFGGRGDITNPAGHACGGRGDITNPAGHACGGRGGSASVHGNIQRMRKSPRIRYCSFATDHGLRTTDYPINLRNSS